MKSPLFLFYCTILSLFCEELCWAVMLTGDEGRRSDGDKDYTQPPPLSPHLLLSATNPTGWWKLSSYSTLLFAHCHFLPSSCSLYCCCCSFPVIHPSPFCTSPSSSRVSNHHHPIIIIFTRSLLLSPCPECVEVKQDKKKKRRLYIGGEKTGTHLNNYPIE